MSDETPPIAVFDLDGTLIDTAPDLIATLNTILERVACPPLEFANARSMIGNGALAMLRAGLGAAGKPVTEDELKGLFGDFIDHYSANIAVHSRPFEGLEAALDILEENGWRLAVCTNKLEGLSVDLLGALDLKDRFATICGSDTFAFKKPDPRHITATVERAGGHAGQAVMVGDSANDILAAQAANVPVVAVDFGYTDRHVSEFDPDAVISSFDALWDAVGRIRRGA